MRREILPLFLMGVLLAFSVAGCGDKPATENTPTDGDLSVDPMDTVPADVRRKLVKKDSPDLIRRRAEELAIAELENLGWKTLRDEESPEWRTIGMTASDIPDNVKFGLPYLGQVSHLQQLNLRNIDVTEALLEQLERLPLCQLELGGRFVTDAGLERLRKLPQLQALTLSWTTSLSDDSLQCLRQLTLLQSLVLDDTGGIKGPGLAHLKNLPLLQRLEMYGGWVTDSALSHLKDVKQLQELVLGKGYMTDAGLEHLKGLTRLRHVNVIETRVTDEGVEDLQKALPGAHIFRTISGLDNGDRSP